MSRVVRWLWDGPGPAARVARYGLAPAAAAVDIVTAARLGAYRTGLFRQWRLPLPAVSVGNLTVGGAGKTPLASWIAGFYASRGVRPAILLRGYGHDEAGVHRKNVPTAMVIEDADRRRGATAAAAAGADVLVLDDGFQHLRVSRELDVVLVAAESLQAARRTVPAGPWRERWGALARADIVVVTRKRSAPSEALDAVRRLRPHVRKACPIAVAELRLSGFEGLHTGRAHPLSMIGGARVLATAGIGDPATFGAQLERVGAAVRLRAWRDHHPYRAGDVAALVRAGREADFIVMTSKDAVKLRGQWPSGAGEPLVANLTVCWESGGGDVARGLDLTIRDGRGRYHP